MRGSITTEDVHFSAFWIARGMYDMDLQRNGVTVVRQAQPGVQSPKCVKWGNA
jgi:hypothetical protein